MADNPLGGHIQGCEEEGTPVERQRPVLIGVEDTNGNLEVPNLGPNGGLLTEPAVGGVAQHVIVDSGTVTANQGTANAAGTNSWPVQGAAAAGAPLAGNPQRTGVSDGANIQDWKQAGSAQGVVNGIGAVGVYGYDVTAAGLTPVPVTSAGNSNTNSTHRLLVAQGTSAGAGDGVNPLLAVDENGNGRPFMTYVSNGSTADRQRNNVDVTDLASASRTTTQTINVTTYNCKGITVILDMTVVGTGSVTVTIDGQDPASGKFYNLLTGTAITTNTTNVYRIQPGLTAVANKDVNCQLPRTIRIVVTANNANAATYSLGHTLHV